MGKQLRTNKKKSKPEDLSIIINHTDETPEIEVRCRTSGQSVTRQRGGCSVKANHLFEKELLNREVHVTFHRDRYELLINEPGNNEVEKESKKDKRKKYRKNIAKALRLGWRCLLAGLQGLAVGYSTPLSAAATLVPEINRSRHKP